MYILFFINIFLMGYFLITQFEKISIIKYFLYLVNICLCEYCIVSTFLLGINSFSVVKALLILALINAFSLFINKEKNKGILSVSKEDIIFVGLILAMVSLVSLKGETIRTGSDVGFYSSKAIDLMYGETESIKTLTKDDMTSEMLESKLFLLQQQYFNVNQSISEVSYTYHSLYTWPALLALFGTIFGLENMLLILTIVYVLAIGNMWYILNVISKVKWSKYIVFPLFAFAPVVIYLAKLPFSEMLFVSVLTAGILFWIDTDFKWRYVAIIAFSVLEAIHFSAIMYLPIIFLLIIYNGILKEEKRYFSIAQIGLLLFSIFFVGNFFVSPDYARNQMIASFGNALSWKVWGAIVLSVSLVGIIALQFLKHSNLFLHAIKCICWWINSKNCYILYAMTFVLIIGIVYNGYLLGFTEVYLQGEGSWAGRAYYANRGIISLLHSNIYSIFIGLSYIGLPFILYKIFLEKKCDNTKFILSIAFLYSLCIYTFIRSDTPSNYYGSRYFVTFLIPIAIILIGYLIKNKKEFVVITIVAICMSLPYTLFLQEERGYQGSVQILSDTLQTVEENSVVVLDVNQNCIQILANNLEEMNSNQVWDIQALADIKQYYSDKTIYVVSNSQKMESEYQEVMCKKYDVTSDIACFDSTDTIVKYPLSTRHIEEKIYIYILNKN